MDDERDILSSLRRLLRRRLSHPGRLGAPKALSSWPKRGGRDCLGPAHADHDRSRIPCAGSDHPPDTVRIVLSGYTELQSITDAINEGAIYKFLTKPWDDDQLRANIGRPSATRSWATKPTPRPSAAGRQLARSNQQLQELLDANQARMVRDETMLESCRRCSIRYRFPSSASTTYAMIVFANGDASTVRPTAAPYWAALPANACLLRWPACSPCPGRSLLWHTGGVPYVVHCRPMGGQASGTLVTLVPTRER